MSLKRQNGIVLNDHEIETRDEGASPYEVYPEFTANALLREAAENARERGMPIIEALVEKVGLPSWMIQIAKKMDFHTLETLRHYLRQGQLGQTGQGLTLAQVEMVIKVKTFILEEITTPPDQSADKLKKFHSAIETAVARKAERPQASSSAFLSPEKGSAEAPEYDGKDPENDIQANLWVIPTRILLWPSKVQVISVPETSQIYKKWLAGLRSLRNTGLTIEQLAPALAAYPEPPMNLRALRYECKDWLRTWKPVVSESFFLPNQKKRDQIERAKMREIHALKAALADYNAAQDEQDPNIRRELRREFWKIAFATLGRKLAGVQLKDVSTAKRISNQIRRRANNRKCRPEGIAILPPVAAGELQPDIEKRIREIQEKNPTLPKDTQFVIEVKFDAELREDQHHKTIITGGIGILVERNRRNRHKPKRLSAYKCHDVYDWSCEPLPDS